MQQTGLPESHSEDALIRERGSLPHLRLETVSCAFFLFQWYGHTISFLKSVVYLLVCSPMCQVRGQTEEVGSPLPLLGLGDGTRVTSLGGRCCGRVVYSNAHVCDVSDGVPSERSLIQSNK